jgi:hypothetical protein
MRGYEELKDWVGSMGRGDQRRVAERVLEGSIDYDLTLEQACLMEVRISGKLRTLAWVAENKPRRLELFMDTMEPGSVLYQAITLVYNANIDRVLKDVTTENARIRDTVMAGLAASREAKAMHVRPVSEPMMQVRPIAEPALKVRPVTAAQATLRVRPVSASMPRVQLKLPRVFLTNEAIPVQRIYLQ